ncbi:hypothetical protein F4678DRAFT_461670 [Xylaria arbuscula]|nr:hypothetical protein F4678DRAFT_461670 [Xylaria arbuscula]
MSSPGKNLKKSRRVSFVDSDFPDFPKPRPSSPRLQPSSTPKSAITRPEPRVRSPPTNNTCPLPASSEPDRLAGLFTHTVTNTPRGLVIDGVLRQRGPTVHSDLRDPQPQPQPFPGHPPYYPNVAHPQVNMSTVGAGIMPDPNAVHYQPPVPDTTNGPFQYTYVPRTDPQYMMAPGVAAGCPPGVYPPGPVPYQQVQPQNIMPVCPPAAPGACGVVFMNASPIRSAHPGMATAPIPMMAAGSQMPPMQPPFMQGTTVNYQPGFGPPMAYGAPPNGPAYVACGIAQPTPPITPPGVCIPGGGGFEMGKTKTELEAESQYNSLHNQMNEPQSMKPADDDKSRMYWCRELDGQWIARSRFSLDRMGNFRWYVTDNGVFYAKMLIE